MRVVFMGTPDFAVSSLEAIYNSPHEIIGVVTAPDKPSGRGLQLQSSEVKKYAVEKNIPVLQPVKLKDNEFIEALKQWKADVFVVVAFRMLPYEVYAIPSKGTFNVHASLLPQYRGAAPIHWAIMNGETQTGVTTFLLNHAIDCGDIILQRKIDILPEENTGKLYDRLKILGAAVALETLSLIETGSLKTFPQPCIEPTVQKLAPKIHKQDTIIDWNLPAKTIVDKIRGLAPFPGAVTFLKKNEKDTIAMKVYEAEVIPEKSTENAGKIYTDNKRFLYISSKDFLISIKNLQLEGKKRLDIDSFLAGNNLSFYTI